jgi:polar amino acid transport system substrate-binding protein
LEDGGIFSRIVSEAFALEGIRAVYKFYPWKRGYLLAKQGQLDGSVTWAPTPERQRDFHFSDPVIFSRKVFFHLKELTFEWRSVKDLIPFRIGATAQYTYGEAFDQAVQEGILNVEYVNRDSLNIRKLLQRRIDLFPMEIKVGYNLIRAEASPEQAGLITHHPEPVQETPICVVISRNIDDRRARRLIETFNRGLQRLKQSGRYGELLQGSHHNR